MAADIYYPGCSTAIPDPNCSDCPPTENGDVRAFFLVKKTFTFTDITDTSEWQTGILAKDIYVFPYTRGTVTVAENVVNGFGDQDEKLDSYTFTAAVEEPNYKDNYGFWNAIKNARNFKFGYKTENYVHLADVAAQFIPKQDVKDGKKSQVNWMISVKFTQDNLIEPFDAPDGVFEQCMEVIGE